MDEHKNIKANFIENYIRMYPLEILCFRSYKYWSRNDHDCYYWSKKLLISGALD